MESQVDSAASVDNNIDTKDSEEIPALVHPKAQEFLDINSDCVNSKAIMKMYDILHDTMYSDEYIKDIIPTAIQQVQSIELEDSKDEIIGEKVLLISFIENLYDECKTFYQAKEIEDIFKTALNVVGETTKGTELEGIVNEFYAD